jgi:hypothetical protein
MSSEQRTAREAGPRRLRLELPWRVVGGALDLDELQSFLSWDIYGIMDLGETISASAGREGDEVRGSEWSSMI